jgi:cathepsin X
MNTCRTCTNPEKGGTCVAVEKFPNATVSEYGNYNQQQVGKIMAEIYIRGPVKASVNAGPLNEYLGGILFDSPITRNTTHNHGVSLVGWGYDDATDVQYWIVRNVSFGCRIMSYFFLMEANQSILFFLPNSRGGSTGVNLAFSA